MWTMVVNVLSMANAAVPCKPAATVTASTDASVVPASEAGYVKTASATRRVPRRQRLRGKRDLSRMKPASSVSAVNQTTTAENQSCTEEVCVQPLLVVSVTETVLATKFERGFCRVRPDCLEDESICGEGEACIGDRCVPSGCRGVDDCEDGEACIGGECRETPTPCRRTCGDTDRWSGSKSRHELSTSSSWTECAWSDRRYQWL